MTWVVLGGALVMVGLIGGAAIWRMEALRRRTMRMSGVRGTVIEKRHAPERWELRTSFQGAPSSTSIVPESFVLVISNSGDTREIVVGQGIYEQYAVGDQFGDGS